jgi:TonB family protein
LRHFASVLVLALAFPSLGKAQTAPSYQSEINSVADRIAQDIQHLPKPRKGSPLPRILVADILNFRGQPNVLGQQLADALSDALQTRLSPNAILPRKQFQQLLQSAGIVPNDLQTTGVLPWQAAQAGATQLVTGRLSRSDEAINLSLTLITVPDGTQASTSTTTLTLPPEIAQLAREAIAWSPDPNSALSCPSPAETKGSLPPKCTRCQPPEFTDAARKAHWQGNLLMKLAIDEQGQVTSAITLAGAPYGVDEGAIATLRQWQFQPATKDGQPIRICVPVEVNLRYY